MRNINSYLCILLVAMLTGCNDLPDEQFEKSAIIIKNGYHEWELPYNGEDEMTAYVSVALSGTSILKEDVEAELKVSPVNLEEYNFDQFRYDESSYYELLPEECYEMESNKVIIPAGSEYGLLPVKIRIDKMNKYHNYILPLEIVSVSKYSIGKNGYNRALVNIVLKNDYSGKYSRTLDLNSSEGGMLITGDQVLRTITPNTCYFTAAYLDKASEQEYYNINMVVNSDSTLTLSAVNPDIELEFASPNKEKDNETNIVEIKDLGKNSKSMKFFLDYSYIDKSNPEAEPVRRYIKGFLLREIKED